MVLGVCHCFVGLSVLPKLLLGFQTVNIVFVFLNLAADTMQVALEKEGLSLQQLSPPVVLIFLQVLGEVHISTCVHS